MYNTDQLFDLGVSWHSELNVNRRQHTNICYNTRMQENTDWYNEKGECDESGCYDAGGHFYAERAAEIFDYFEDR